MHSKLRAAVAMGIDRLGKLQNMGCAKAVELNPDEANGEWEVLDALTKTHNRDQQPSVFTRRTGLLQLKHLFQKAV